MNREKIIALLKAQGISVDNSATDEQLLEKLTEVLNAKKTVPIDSNAEDVKALREAVNLLTEQNKAEKKTRIEAAVDKAVNESRIPAAQRDSWVKRAVNDDTVLADIAALPPVLPGAEPVSNAVDITAESSSDIEKAIKRFREPTNSFLRGNATDPKVIGAAAVQNAIFHRKNRARIMEVINANTIGADLKRNAVLQEIMRAFRENLAPFNIFSTVFNNVPLEGTDKIAVPFYPLATAASTDFASAYVMGDSDIQDKDVTIDKRKYQPIRFSSSELNRQPAINLVQLGLIKAEKLAADVFANVLSVVTNANYGAAAFTGAASTFDSSDVTDLKGVADVAEWPKEGRSLFVKSAYDVNLLKDSSVKAALNFGNADAIQDGSIRKILGFAYFMNDNIPANGENLVGFIAWRSAILVATSPILPVEEVRRLLTAYEVVVDPQLGISFEYRRWGNADSDERREVIECNYGFSVGDVPALERLVSA